MKNKNYYITLAALAAVLAAAPSCKDDDKQSDPANEFTDEVVGLEEIEADDLAGLISTWCNIPEAELAKGFSTQTHTPDVGVVMDEAHPEIRCIKVNSVQEADTIAASMLSALGFDIERAESFSYTSDNVTKISYRHAGEHDDSNTLAAIEVDVEAIPLLQEIKFVKSIGTNAGETTPFYHIGDVIQYKDNYYLCVSNHKVNTMSRWISFGGIQETTTCGWGMAGEDFVYKEKMASFQTIYGWIYNILLNDNNFNAIYNNAELTELQKNDLLPTPDIKEKLIKQITFDSDCDILDLFSNPNNTETDLGEILKQYNAKNTGKVASYDKFIVSPTDLFLADKINLQKTTSSVNNYWVPYVLLVKDSDISAFEKLLTDSKSQSSLSTKYFEKRVVPNHDKPAAAKYSVYEVAAFWMHAPIVYRYDNMTKSSSAVAVFDFATTKSSDNASDQEYRWLNRNITTKELTFTDKGSSHKYSEDVYRKNGK